MESRFLEREIPGTPHRYYLAFPQSNASVLERFLLNWQVGEAIPIGIRDGRWIRMTLRKYRILDLEDYLAPKGTHRFVVSLEEGNNIGRATFHLGTDFVSGGWLTTEKMDPGVGTIVSDWLTALAHYLGRRRDFVAIQNPRIYKIIDRSQLILPETSWIEAYTPTSEEPDSYELAGRAPYSEQERFRAENPYASYFTVRGTPNGDREGP